MQINTEKCVVCSGKGYIHLPKGITTESWSDPPGGKRAKKIFENILCPKCRGCGKVDWVSKVTNYREPEVPLLKELTDDVSKLMKEDNIFGVSEIKIEHERRMILKKHGKSK